MTTYNGIIEQDFIRAEIHFDIVLPAFCENQAFKLFEQMPDGVQAIRVFDLLLNSREDIVSTDNGIAYYTGRIAPTEVETVVIAQVIIDKRQVDGFAKRKFMLEVV